MVTLTVPALQPMFFTRSDAKYSRVPGAMRPYYVHTPTTLVYESPYLTTPAIGSYSLSNGVFTYDPTYLSTLGTLYRSLPVQRPYSAASLARQGGRYPPTSYTVPSESAYRVSYYKAPEYYRAPEIYNAGLLMG